MRCIASSSIRNLFYLFFFAVVVSALFFPAELDNPPGWFYAAGDFIADVRVNKKISSFPAALVATYLAAVVFALFLAICSCFSEVVLKIAFLLRVGRGSIRRSLLLVMAVFMPFLLICVEAIPQSGTAADLFFSAMANNRIILMLWCVAVFLLFFAAVSVFCASIAGIFIDGGSG